MEDCRASLHPQCIAAGAPCVSLAILLASQFFALTHWVCYKSPYTVFAKDRKVAQMLRALETSQGKRAVQLQKAAVTSHLAPKDGLVVTTLVHLRTTSKRSSMTCRSEYRSAPLRQIPQVVKPIVRSHPPHQIADTAGVVMCKMTKVTYPAAMMVAFLRQAVVTWWHRL